MIELLGLLLTAMRALAGPRQDLVLENLLLRHQLAVFTPIKLLHGGLEVLLSAQRTREVEVEDHLGGLLDDCSPEVDLGPGVIRLVQPEKFQAPGGRRHPWD